MSKNLILPTSHAQRLLNLQRVHTMALSETEEHFLEPAMVAEVGQLVLDYEAALQRLQDQESQSRHLRATLDPLMDRLILVVRASWASLRSRQNLENLPLKFLNVYGLSRRANPLPGKYQEWIQWGQRLVSGEADALLQGYEPMIQPDLATLSLALEGTGAADLALAKQLVDLNSARKSANSLASEVVVMLQKTGLAIRLTMYGDKKSSRRQVMRRFGFKFRSNNPVPNLPTEPETPDPETPDPETPDTETPLPNVDMGSLPQPEPA